MERTVGGQREICKACKTNEKRERGRKKEKEEKTKHGAPTPPPSAGTTSAGFI